MAHLQRSVIYPLGDAHLAAYRPLFGFVRAPLPRTFTTHSPTHARDSNRAPQAGTGRSWFSPSRSSLSRSLAKGACLARSPSLSLHGTGLTTVVLVPVVPPLLKLCIKYHQHSRARKEEKTRERERERERERAAAAAAAVGRSIFLPHLDRIGECGRSMMMACAAAGLPQGLPSHFREYYVVL